MKAIEMVSNIAGGFFSIVGKGILYIIMGAALGATLLTLLISAIIATTF